MTKLNVLPEKTWDLVVVGGGLVGWTTAALALAKGRRVLLLEKSARFGGRLSPELRHGFSFGAGFAFGDTTVWKRVAEKLDLGLEWQPVARGEALSQGTKGWVPVPAELPQWETFAATTVQQIPHGGAPAFLQKLKQYSEAQGEDFHSAIETPVQQIWCKEGRVEKLVLGSGQEIFCKDLVWTADAKGLIEVLKGEGLPEEGVARVAWIKKFTKAHNTPAVVLEFAHKQRLSEFSETLLLPFSAADKEERRFLAGSFVSERDSSLAPQGKQISSWICALSDAEWDDNHETMKKIRAAKRLLEKSFAGFEASIADERVLVLEHSFTPLAKRKGDWKPLLDNLFLLADWAAPAGSQWQSVLELLEEQDALFAPDAGQA